MGDEHHSTMVQSQERHKVELCDLPSEIIHRIIADCALTPGDRKLFRLTCRRLSGIATSHVFRRISLSRLLEDRNNVANITESPHLAPLVRELVWYDLNLEEPIIQPWYAGCTDPDASVWEREFRAFMADAEVFWLTRVDEEGASAMRECRRFHFQVAAMDDILSRALRNAPGIDTVAVRPMPQDRILGSTSGGYAITASWFFGDAYRGSIAMDQFLLPILRSPDSRVKKLFLADADVPFMSHVAYLRLQDTTAFERLTMINFCMSLRPLGPESILPESSLHPLAKMDILAKCLHAAKALDTLTLCLERASITAGQRTQVFSSVFGACNWPRLRRLELVDCEVAEPPEVFLRLLATHRSSLRHLTLFNCGLMHSHVGSLFYDKRERIGCLKLQSIMICEERGWDGISIAEEDLLAVLNQGCEPPPAPLDDIDALEPSFSGWCAPARRADSTSECDDPWEEQDDVGLDEADAGTLLDDGLPLRTHRLAFDHGVTITHSPAYFHSQLNPEEFTAGQRAEMEVRMEREVTALLARAPPDVEEEEVGSEISYVESEDPQEAEEDYLEDCPNWSWGRYCGTLYYWPDEHGSIETENWRFTHSSGEWAITDEPLNYWECWKGADEGDTAEAVPYGPAFSRIQNATWESDRCFCEMLTCLYGVREYDAGEDIMASRARMLERERRAGMAVRNLRGGLDEGTCRECWNLDKRMGGSTAALVALLREAGLPTESLERSGEE